jgi:hypothetical protein
MVTLQQSKRAFKVVECSLGVLLEPRHGSFVVSQHLP